MNEFDKNEVIELTSNDYNESNYKNNNTNINLGNLFPLIIPLIFIFSSNKGKKYNSISTTHDTKKTNGIIPSRRTDFDVLKNTDQMVDKLSNVVDVMKKINKLNDIKKVNLNGKGNLDGIQEAFSIFKNVFSDTSHVEKLDSLESTISTIKKVGEIKKVMDLQKAFTSSNSSNSNSSISDMVDAITPLMSEKNDDNLKNLQKIVQMASLISTLNNDKK